MENIRLHHSLMNLPMSQDTRHELLVRYYQGQKEMSGTHRIPRRLAKLASQQQRLIYPRR